MHKLLALLVLVGSLGILSGCSHTSKKYYEEDRHGDYHRESRHDYDRHHDHDRHH